MGDTVLYERDGHVATITYNRPEALNAINADLRNDLNDAWVRFRDDEEAWVAIVTGQGRAFSAGADLRDRRPPQGGTFWEMPSANSLESGLEIWKPVIAAVNGYCLGFALTLVAACGLGYRQPRSRRPAQQRPAYTGGCSQGCTCAQGKRNICLAGDQRKPCRKSQCRHGYRPGQPGGSHRGCQRRRPRCDPRR